MPRQKQKSGINFRKLNWEELTSHFTSLCSYKELSPNQIVDYFNYKRLQCIGIKKWSLPNRKWCYDQFVKANVLLSSYGPELSIALIDILFDKYDEFWPGKIIYPNTLDYLIAQNYSFIFEKAMSEYIKRNSQLVEDQFNRLMKIPQNEWSSEDFQTYNRLQEERRKVRVGK